MSGTEIATVTVLTAQITTLVIGNRDVTRAMVDQLDVVPPEECEPWGRVHHGQGNSYVAVVGRRVTTGELVRSGRRRPDPAKVAMEDRLVELAEQENFTSADLREVAARFGVSVRDYVAKWLHRDRIRHDDDTGRYVVCRDGVALRSAPTSAELPAKIAEFAAYSSLPLIVLAG